MMIRSATPSDIPQLLPMIAKICALHQSWDEAKYGFRPHPEQTYQSWLTRLLQHPRHVCLVAEPEPIADRDYPLAAFLIATIEQEIPIYRVKEFGFIQDLWVEEPYRRTGIAQELVQATIEHFQRLGIPQIRLDTAAANQAARSLFTTCGFRPSTIEMLIELEDSH